MYANAVERLPQDALCNAAAELSYKLLFKSSIDRRWSSFTEYWRQRSLTCLHLTRFHCTLGHRLRSYITTHKHACRQITKNLTLFKNSNWSVKTPVNHTTTTLRPFSWDHPGEPVPEENFWTLWCKGRLTEADTPTIWPGATPSGLNGAHLHHPPFFTGQMPFMPPNQQCQSTVGNWKH